jgi:hypothetical protein
MKDLFDFIGIIAALFLGGFSIAAGIHAGRVCAAKWFGPLTHGFNVGEINLRQAETSVINTPSEDGK